MAMPAFDAPRVLIAEGDRKSATRLGNEIEEAGYRVRLAFTGRAVIEEVESVPPDVVLLDHHLPLLDSDVVCREVRNRTRVPIIMLADAPPPVEHGEVSPDDYILEPYTPQEVVARVRACLRRASRGPQANEINTVVGDLTIDRANRSVQVDGESKALTPSEFTLLEILARRPGRIMSREQLAERLYGEDSATLERTIDAHIMNLRKKVEVDRRAPRRIVTVPGMGYRLAV
jgi:DNA-binding response OmpR family regulator